MRPVSAGLAALLVPAVVLASDGPFVKLEELTPAAGRVVVVRPPLPSAWGEEQLIQLPVHGTIHTVRAAGDVRVHLAPGGSTRVAVRTDPGLLSTTMATLERGQLRLDSGTRAQVPSYLVEAPAPSGVRADDHAVVEIPAWEGQALELLAYGEGEIHVGSIRAGVLRIVARHEARVVVTGACEAADLIVDTADQATFKGCGVASGE